MASIQKRVSADGTISFRVQVRLKGYPPERASFERLTDARKWAQQIESAMQEGRHFKTSEAKKNTLKDEIQRYRAEILPHKSNKNEKTYLHYWEKTLGDYCLADVTPALIVKHRNLLLATKNRMGHEIGQSTANRYMESLSCLMNIAKKEWLWIQENPTENIKKFKEPRGRIRFLDDAERAALLSACKDSANPHLYAIVILALSTGARKNEILTLQWKDIGFKRGVFTLHETKNGERRVVPLQGHALNIVKGHSKVRQLHCPYVFPSPTHCQPIEIKRAWYTALEKAGIHDFRFHDLRHSAASYLAMNGASLAEIAEVLGHKTLQMVKRYAHLSEAHTVSVVKQMNERIFKDA